MKYHPKLKKAMQQIIEILNQHDIAGSIVLHTPGFGEHYLKLDPSYSAMKFNHHQEGMGIDIKIKSKEVGKDKAQQLATDTSNLSHILTTLVGQHAILLMKTEEELKNYFDSIHTGSGNSSEQSQSN